MRTRIAKWGNSLGVRIPKAFTADAGLADGDGVEITLEGGRIVITPVGKDYRLGELVDRTGSGQANISKHLQLLHRQGFVERRKEGTSSCYRIGDPAVFELCDLVCGTIREQLERQQEALTTEGSSAG